MHSALEVGAELPSLRKTFDRSQLVKYAAGSGDFNPLHFDPDFPRARELGDNIVHGRLKYAALGQLVAEWLGHAGFIRRISASYGGTDRRGEPIICRGRVAEIRSEADRQLVIVELWTESCDGRRTTEGSAEVVLQS